MENINKFKVFTIIIICTFVFIIAAIYTNTKDVTEEKSGGNVESVQQEEYGRYKVNDSYDTRAEINKIHQRLDELSSRVDNSRRSDSNSTNLKCKIAGTLSARGMEEMSPSAAVNDARINRNDLVVLCSF